jgi:RNA polymerase sigma-70 factor (ECF subfamily)
MNETRLSLLQRLSNRADTKSWREFNELYEPMLLAYLLKQGVDRNSVQDVVQNVFILLLRKLHQFDRGKGRFRTWLWQVAHNALVDFRRKENVVKKAERNAQKEEEVTEPDDDWEMMHRQRILEFAKEQVRQETSPKTWACFEEHILKGRPGSEVGRELDLTVNTVHVHSSRVLKQIRERCAAYREDLGDD